MREALQFGYVVKMFPRLSETFIRNEILELERQGLALRIYSLKRPGATEAKQAGSGVQAVVVYLPDRPWREPLRVLRAQINVLTRHPRGYWRTLLHVLRGRERSALGRGLRRFCQTCCLVADLGPVRHLHAHFATDPTRLASWARMISGVSYSVTTHAKDLFQENRIHTPGLRYKLGRARFVVANSQHSAAELRAAFNGNAPPRILTIYNGLDLSTFKQRQKEPERPLILSAGRLVEKKGFQNLIAACRVLKDRRVEFHCEIVGSGPLKDLLSDEVAKSGLEAVISLRGQMPQRELHERYQCATVFALPCVVADDGDRDILPNVLKEAMAVGVPVVTTRLEGINELVEHLETGLVVPPGDPEALAEALRLLLTDRDLRLRLAAQARKVVEARFDQRMNFTELRNLLLETVPRGRAIADPAAPGQFPPRI